MTRAEFLRQLNRVAGEIQVDRIAQEDDDALQAILTLYEYTSKHMTDADRCWGL